MPPILSLSYNKITLNATKKLPAFCRELKIRECGKSIASSLIFTSSFGLLLPLETRAYVMLSLLDLSDNAVLLAASLEALQSTLQRLVLFDTDFRH